MTSYQEDQTEHAFDNGDAAFARNWPYQYGIGAGATSKVKGKFSVTVLPHGASGKSVGTVGGWQLAVSKYSKHKDAAIEFVRYMTSPAVEKFDALTNSNVPTIVSVAKDKAVRAKNPYLKPAIASVPRVTRPAKFLKTHYNEASKVIYQGVNQILNGTPAKNVLPSDAVEAQPDHQVEARTPRSEAREDGTCHPPSRFSVSTVATPARAPRRRRRRSKLQRRQTRIAWLLLVPALAVVAFVAIYPLGKTVYQSFTNQEFLAGLEPTKWVGLENYRTLWHDSIFRHAVWVTVKFTLITVAFEFVLGLIIALVVNSHFRGRGLMRAIMLVPWAIPTVVAAKIWQWMLDDVFGVVNDLLMKLHIISHPHAWISDPATSLASVSAVDIWKTTPFVALLLLAGLQVIPRDLYEAADVDGASPLQQFWRITLPLLRPAILVTLIFRTLDALRVFDVFYVFFGNRPDTQTMAIYAQSTIVGDGHVGYGAAISVAIFLIIAVFVVIYVTFMRVTGDEE